IVVDFQRHTPRRVTHASVLLSISTAAGMRVECRALRRSLATNQFTRRRSGLRSCPARYFSGRVAAASAMTTSPVLQEYFREAESWDADRSARFRRSAAVAWWV